MSITIHCGDCLDVVPTLGQVDAVLTDPPYGLSFMGKDWDHGVPGVRFWETILAAVKPGAHLLAFGGTRTFHRLTVAIEDAGFEIRDCIMWIYGTGFPKSLDVSKAIDKATGAERESIGIRSVPDIRGGQMHANNRGEHHMIDITLPATDAAKQWDGWGTALKPAWEPIILARKPLSGTVAANVLEHGTGGVNVAGCRVGVSKRVPTRRGISDSKIFGTFGGTDGTESGHNPSLGRWPANVIHDGSDDVTKLFPWAPSSRFFYCAKASQRERGHANDHPTVKPIALMRYLARLITPPNGTILDPFVGSGSTLLAARDEGFSAIGIDTEKEYCDIARRRLGELPIVEEVESSSSTPRQLGLFV